MYTAKPFARGALALAVSMLTACGGGGNQPDVPQNTPVTPSGQVDNTPSTPDTPAIEITEDYKTHFLALLAGDFNGYGSLHLNDTPVPCSVAVTTENVNVFGASFDLLRPEVQVDIFRDVDGYHLLASTVPGSSEVTGVAWNVDGTFATGLIGQPATPQESHVCSDDERVTPGSLKGPVALAREVASLLAPRNDNFPAGACLTTSPGALAKFNEKALPISIVDGHILKLGNQTYDLDIGSKNEAVTLSKQDIQRVLKLSTQSLAGPSYILQMTKPYGMHFFSHDSGDGTSILCAKKVGS